MFAGWVGIVIVPTEVLAAVAGVCLWVLARGRAPLPRLVGKRGLWPKWAGVGRSGPWWGTGFGIVSAVILGSPVLVVSAPLVALFGRRELGRRHDRVAVGRRADMAVDFVADAAAGLRAGRSLTGAVLDGSVGLTGRREANALRVEVAGRVAAGRPFALAVDEVLGDGSVDERLIATTIRALDATGASAGAALERVLEALGERQSSRDDARTQAQHALSSAGVLAALPFVFGLAAALAEPDVARLYVSTWLGAGCVGAALVLIFGSWEWLQRLLGSPL